MTLISEYRSDDGERTSTIEWVNQEYRVTNTQSGAIVLTTWHNTEGEAEAKAEDWVMGVR